MSFTTYGDLASTFHSRQLSARMKQDIAQLGFELTTGRKTNVATHISGDFGPVAGIEHSLKLLSAHEQNTIEANIVFGGTQTVLGNIQNQSQLVSDILIKAIGAQNTGLLQSVAADARGSFQAVISNLNTSLSGRSLFAGAATDGPALADADFILSELETYLAGETTAAGISARIDEWFHDIGGGFETSGFLGVDEEMGAFRLRDGETAIQSIKANDPEIRDVLSALAKSTFIASNTMAADPDEQKKLAEQVSHETLAANDKLTILRAETGRHEARIEAASVRNTSEKTALELSLNDLIGADPYETTTALQELYHQMESLYLVTARMSELTFMDYMR